MYGIPVIGYVRIAIFLSTISSSIIFGQDINSNFIGKSSEDITQLILKSTERNASNVIFSPFGYSVILGILSEGTRGDTRAELEKILHSPDDANSTRNNFKTILQRLQEKSAANVPEFRNYFYVYKNFTVDDDYKTILLHNYFTQVRSVDRPNYDDFIDTTTTSSTSTAAEPITTSVIRTNGTVVAAATATTITVAENSTTSTTNNKLTSESANAEPKRNRETGQIWFNTGEINRERVRRLAKRLLGIELGENVSKSELSGMSANGLQGRDFSGILSKMLVFNGLYFRGYWKTPFQYKQGEEPFYKSSNEKIMTKMIYTVGQFHVGRIEELDSIVLCMPYKGERYSFMVVLPDRRDGTRKVISNLKKINLADIHSKLEAQHVQISLPAFEFNTISYLKEPLKSIGINTIFSEQADFSGLSKERGLFVDDIVQLVTIKLDNEAGTPNFLTASSVQTRTVAEKYTVDRPFVFFIQDHKDNLIIAAGKLHDPTRLAEEN